MKRRRRRQMAEIGDRDRLAADDAAELRAPCRAAARAARRACRARGRSPASRGGRCRRGNRAGNRACFSSTSVLTPARANSRPAIIPAGPPPAISRSVSVRHRADNRAAILHKGKMTHGDFSTSGLSDALVILGAAGIVIPAFARIRISPVIGFILIGILVGPSGLGAMTERAALAQLRHHHQPRGDRAVRRVRHHPAALLDRAGAVASAGCGGCGGWCSASARRELLASAAADRRRASISRGHGWIAAVRARPRAGPVLDRGGAAVGRHDEPGRPLGLRDAAVRGSGDRADHLRARRARAACAGGAASAGCSTRSGSARW